MEQISILKEDKYTITYGDYIPHVPYVPDKTL